jgi:hypothetical protein
MTAKRLRKPHLPGMEDPVVSALDEAAIAYAELRDQRMALLKQEVSLKQRTLALMKKYRKTIYRHDGIEIDIVPAEEMVHVKVRKAATDEDEDADDEA